MRERRNLRAPSVATSPPGGQPGTTRNAGTSQPRTGRGAAGLPHLPPAKRGPDSESAQETNTDKEGGHTHKAETAAPAPPSLIKNRRTR